MISFMIISANNKIRVVTWFAPFASVSFHIPFPPLVNDKTIPSTRFLKFVSSPGVSKSAPSI